MKPSCDKTVWLETLLVLLCILIVSCGGGGVADLASTGGGTGGTGVSSGSVTAIGSVYVNGVRYDTRNAEIFYEGQSVGLGDPAVLANLAVGMVVRVEGDIEDRENGSADRVYFNDDLRGPVESIVEIDAVTYQLVVLGKTVVINELTNLMDVTIDPGLIGDWIQVSGFEYAEGRIQATFVTEIIGALSANLKGVITAIDPANTLITINGLNIIYQGAVLIGIDQLATGLLVEVTGDLMDPVTINADTIEIVDFLGNDDIDSIELGGIISEKLSNSEFLLNGVRIVVDAQTIYTGGDADDVAEGVRVEAEGQLSNGIVYAERIIFMDFAKAESDVAENDTAASVITLHGLADIPIRYNPITRVTGTVTSTALINDSHHVKVIGRKLPPSEMGTMVAVHIITKDTLNDKVIVQGALESDPPFIQTTISLLGHAVDISGVPDDSFESQGGTGYAAFYDSTRTGDIVSAKGVLFGGDVTWQSISTQ
jgi:hypothetical protein